MRTKFLLIILILLTAMSAFPAEKAALKLPSFFCNNMVLPQYFDAPMWGKATPGRNSVFVPAKAVIEGSSVFVSSENVAEPVAVRFGWSNAAEPILFNMDGQPASSFRTDTWPRTTEIKEGK